MNTGGTSTVWPYTTGDCYTCPVCGQGVWTTLGQHFCPGHRVTSTPTITTTSTLPLLPSEAASLRAEIDDLRTRLAAIEGKRANKRRRQREDRDA